MRVGWSKMEIFASFARYIFRIFTFKATFIILCYGCPLSYAYASAAPADDDVDIVLGPHTGVWIAADLDPLIKRVQTPRVVVVVVPAGVDGSSRPVVRPGPATRPAGSATVRRLLLDVGRWMRFFPQRRASHVRRRRVNNAHHAHHTSHCCRHIVCPATVHILQFPF